LFNSREEVLLPEGKNYSLKKEARRRLVDPGGGPVRDRNASTEQNETNQRLTLTAYG
jgi:hypothetical protein